MTREEKNELKELAKSSGHRIVITKYFVTIDGKTFSNDENAYQTAKREGNLWKLSNVAIAKNKQK